MDQHTVDLIVQICIPIIAAFIPVYFWRASTKKLKEQIERTEKETLQVQLLEEESVELPVQPNPIQDDRDDTMVVVPTGWSYVWNATNKIYFCQTGRSFRPDTRYLGLYKKWKVLAYGVMKKIPLHEVISRIEEREDDISLYVKEQKGNLDYYDLSEEFTELFPGFVWEWSIVQKQQYTSRLAVDPEVTRR